MRDFSSVFILIAVLLMTGCPRYTVLYLFNNSEEVFDFEAESLAKEWKNHETIEWSNWQLSKKESDGGLVYSFYIKNSDASYIYSISMDDIEDFVVVGSDKPLDEIRFQLEKDKCLYVVSPKDEFPSKDLGRQPKKFPFCGSSQQKIVRSNIN